MIETDNDPYYEKPDGSKGFLEELAIFHLINEEIMFIGCDLKVVIICNDFFDFASADTEEFEWKNIQTIYEAYKENHAKGVLRWCCLHRRMRPIAPIEDKWKKDGFWDSELEALPERKDNEIKFTPDPYFYGDSNEDR